MIPARGVVSPELVGERRKLKLGPGMRPRRYRPGTRVSSMRRRSAGVRGFDPYGAAQSVASTPSGDDGPSGGETTHISVVDAMATPYPSP